MDYIGEIAFPAGQFIDGPVKGHRKSGDRAAGHPACDLNWIFEFEQGKSQFDGLVVGNGTGGVHKHAVGADILDDIPERPLPDRVFDNDERGPAGVRTLIAVAFRVHLIILALENRKMGVLY
jgi:hypothetical protein